MDSVIYFWILLSLSSWKQATACLEDVPCRTLAFPASLFFANKRFVNHTIQNVRVRDLAECERLCYEEHNCVSINFETKKDGNGRYSCDLNNSTHGEHDEDLVNEENYFYRGTENACGKSPCQNGGTCQSGFTKKNYHCLCPSGFMGGNCQYDINECYEKTDECDENAECYNKRGNYKCICKSGYTGDGYKCTDIDECTDKTHGCNDNAMCNNTNGSYNCTCSLGFTGDGRNCTAMMDSKIIFNNGFYLRHLGMFLAPFVGNNSDWKLCYRSTTHGAKDTIFHDKCDGKRNTVTIVKENEYVFGGFTDIPWESKKGKFGETSKALLFSLRNNEGLEPFQSTVEEPAKAIYNDKSWGPTFGNYDLRINRLNGRSSTNLGECYSVPPEVQDHETVLAGTQEFEPDEVEVFYLV